VAAQSSLWSGVDIRLPFRSLCAAVANLQDDAMRPLVFALLFTTGVAAQPLRQPTPVMQFPERLSLNYYSEPQPGLFTLWPNSRSKVTGSLGFNTINWGGDLTPRNIIGYDVRAEFYISQSWSFTLRQQNMYITSEANLLGGVAHRFPLQRKKPLGPKL